MKKLFPLFLLLSALAVNAATTPAFLPTLTTLVNAFTNTSVGSPHSVVVADIFGNGKPALISANDGGSTLTVLTNNGNNVFGLNGTLSVGTTAFSMAAASVNGSSHVDLICAHYNYDSLTVLTNNGSGGFATSQTIQLKSGSEPYAVTAADIYNNGKPALISANYESGTLTVLTNAGGGIFGSNATLNAGSEPECVVAADVNGDGYADLICANYGSGSISVFTNNGSGGFAISDTIFLKPGTLPDAVTVADIYNNGKPALISVNYQGNTLTVLTNAGGGIFGSNATCSAGSEPTSVTSADVNQDGYADLICANYISQTLIVLTNNGSGGFVPACTNGVAAQPYDVVAGNIFGNGKPDLVAAGNGSLTVISNLTAQYSRTFTVGSLTNLSVSAPGSPTAAFGTTNALPAGLTFTDNGNGSATLAGTPAIGAGGVYNLSLTASNSAGLATQTVTLTVNQLPIFPGFSFAASSTNVVAGQPHALTVANLFGNGKPALISANQFGNNLTVLTNAGNGVYGSNATYSVGSNPAAVVAADILGNGQPALISANYNNNTLTVLTNNGSGSFGFNATLNVGGDPDSVVAVDISGNGKLALITANSAASSLTVLTNNGSGGFHLFTTLNVGSVPESLITADINGDGKPDLICVNYNASTVSVLTNNGGGSFVTSDTISLKAGSNPNAVTVADIFGNGKPGLVTANGNGTLTVLTNAGGGIFGSNATYSVSGNLAFVMAADVSEDGHVDLVTANYESDLLTILTNNGAGRFVAANVNTPLFVNGAIGPIAAADVNADGRMDLICGTLENNVIVLTNGALLKVTYTENAAGKAFTPPLASGYPAPSLSESGALPGRVTFTGGVLSGTPNPGTPGTYNFLLTETNVFGTSSENLALTVISAIGASPYEIYTDVGMSATFATNDLLTYDSDRDGYALSVTAVSATSTNGGTVLLNNGSYTYTPVSGFTGQDVITFTIADSGGDMAQSYLKILVVPPPASETYSLAADENTPQDLSTNDLLSYDYDYAYFTVGITAVSATSTNGGTVVLDNGTGNIIYTPVTGFTGQDQFAYAFADSDGGTNVGIVSVTVYPLPVAVTFTVSTAYNTPLVVPLANVLNNDSDPGGLPLGIPAVSATSMAGGTVTLDTVNGNFDYAPATGFTGQDAFTYTLADNIGGTVPGTVSVIVTHPGAPPMNTIGTQLSANGTQLGLTFSGQPGQSYYFQSATNVFGPYADVPPSIMADASGYVTNAITISPTTPEQFYRIRQGP